MGGKNSSLRFPDNSSIYSGNHARSTDNFTVNPERSKANALRREAGVFVVSTEMSKSPLAQEAASRPRRHRRSQRTEHSQVDHAGNPSPLSTQIDDEGILLLEALDPEDPHYLSKRRGIIAHHTRVWEPIGATPLVIDFSNVQEPINPQRLPPSAKGSQHPQVPLYKWAKAQAHKHDPRSGVEGRATRNDWYWDQMDRGNLPHDFNPYRPGSPAYNAFAERVSLRDDRPQRANNSKYTGDAPVLMTPRQIRSRARRKAAAGERLTDEEFVALYDKPLEEWDIEELAAGRPKDVNGQFRGRAPGKYLQREIAERAENLFKTKVRTGMNGLTVSALEVMQAIIDNDDYDVRGKPVVAASTKLDASKFLIEHLLGKPKQHVENDIGARLSTILAGVMVAPEVAPPMTDSYGNHLPVTPTGRMLAGQRGHRTDYVDEQVLALERAGVIDAVVVDDDDDEEGEGGEG